MISAAFWHAACWGCWRWGASSEGELSSIAIPIEDLGRPALLTIWPMFDVTAKCVEPREMASLRGALDAAFDALRDGTGSPWIITENGLILTPGCLTALMPFAEEFRGPGT